MRIVIAVFVVAGLFTAQALDRYVSLTGGHVPPFTSWADAATNMQAAVDAAVAGDTVWVTNGLYNTGGKTMAGDLTNRVALDKAVTLQSVNGPETTVIVGQASAGTNSVRCAWLTNGAILSGFTLEGGSTPFAAYGGTLYSGAGVWCSSRSAVVQNCVIVSNSASLVGSPVSGGGAYSGTLESCVLMHNYSPNSGGGAYDAALNNCLIASNRSWNGGGVASCTLTDCEVVGNSAEYGGGAWGGFLEGSLVIGNTASRGGGAYLTSLTNCVVSGNTAYNGGGSINATLYSCVVSNNTADNTGGGAASGVLANCRILGNAASSGGGASGGTLRNCQISRNFAETAGGVSGATLYNCTVTRNSASDSVGGVDGAIAKNSIIWLNSAPSDPDFRGGGFEYSCMTPLAAGLGNLDLDPQLITAGRISTNSPCRGAGNSSNATGTDIDDQPWANPPSIGCDEVSGSTFGGALSVDLIAVYTNLAENYPGAFEGKVVGPASAIKWDFGDGQVSTNSNFITIHAWSLPGDHTLTFTAYNDDHPSGVSATLFVHVLSESGVFVSLEGGHKPPFASWADAATNIQAAVEAAAPGQVVQVTDGLYASGGRAIDGSLTNRVAIDKPITLRSVNGPAATVIQGAWDPVTTNGPLAVRCAWLASGATLSGFSLQGGAVRTNGEFLTQQVGGGVWCESTNSLITNCVLSSNAARYGGAAYQGKIVGSVVTHNIASVGGGGGYYTRLSNSDLTQNSASSGGGALYGSLEKCRVVQNTAALGGGAFKADLEDCEIRGNVAGSGGGAYEGTLTRCAVVENTATADGGGICSGSTVGATVLNSRISGNRAGSNGGGVYAPPTTGAIVQNSFLADNQAGSGGGCYGGTLRNCTVTRNTATGGYGGGTRSSVLWNCIVVDNAGLTAFGYQNYYSGGITYTCTTPLPSGAGNIDVDPQLLADGMHLAATSPCIGKGSATYLASADIDGQAWSAPPSMGCDEWHPQPIVDLPTPGVDARSGRPLMRGLPIGEAPFSIWWYKDGSLLTNGSHYLATDSIELGFEQFSPSDAGAYHVIVSNAFGIATSGVAQVSVHCVDVHSTNAVAPFADWNSAATNIQDAIDVAAPGSVVLVTNGVYDNRGKILSGDLVNRIAIDKPLVVASVNGPEGTIIRGAWHPGTTNGTTAVRCAWLAHGASLGGFTLTSGATRSASAGDLNSFAGGVFGSGEGSVLANCWITTNRSAKAAGGAYQVSLYHCRVLGNGVLATTGITGVGIGGGAYDCILGNCLVAGNFANNFGGGTSDSRLQNCALVGNSCEQSGGAASGGTLVNCTVSSNSSGGYLSSVGAVANATLTNCIVYGNKSSRYPLPGSSTNYLNCTLAYSCSEPLPPGVGNISVNPQLLADGIHLAAGSPCLGSGTPAVVSGSDFDGQDWKAAPAMGCDEWHPEPILITEPTAQARGAPGTVLLSGGSVAGEPPSDFAWFREGILVNDGPAYAGAQTGELTVRLSAPTAAGGYQVVVSNAYGVATSSVVSLTLHYVDAAGTSPVPPYASWSSAATNIQEAIDAAALGAVVVVADGEYAHGGRPVLSSPTNRVVLDKAVSLVSMNGAHATIIKGARDPIGSSGIGEAAVRCAWLEAGGILNGFTLTAGATKQVAYSAIAGGGGGVYCRSPDALVFNSILKDNSAYYEGGGARRGTLRNCLLTDNICALYGGGAAGATLWNCTVTANTGGSGGGISGCTAHNSIVFFNSGADQVSSTLTDSCFPGASPSQGNISADPQLVDAFHLGVNSPCRGAGTSVYNTGFDLDGQAWLSPPSMGCDEVYEADFVGPLAVAIEAIDTNVVQGVPLSLTGVIDGLASRLAWGFGDGMVSSNLSFITLHSWTNPGDYTVIFTAFNTDNPAGVSTNVTIQVLPLLQPELSAGSLSNNTFTLNLITQPGVTYQVEQTTNLTPPVVWNLLKNVTGTGDLLPVTDAAATNEMRFYRARVP